MAKKRLGNARRNTGATKQLALLGGKPVGTVQQPVYP